MLENPVSTTDQPSLLASVVLILVSTLVVFALHYFVNPKELMDEHRHQMAVHQQDALSSTESTRRFVMESDVKTPWWQYVIMWVGLIGCAWLFYGCEAEEKSEGEVRIPCDMRVKEFFWPEHFKISVSVVPMEADYHPTVHTLLDIHIDQNVVGVNPQQILVREWRCKDGPPKVPYAGVPPTPEEMNRKALQPPIVDPAAH